jgi:RecB family endonuclease NucS
MEEFLDKFILQAHDNDLTYAHYPREHSNLVMRVSFGQGGPAKVPWIAFITDGMLVSNGFYPVYLYYKDFDMLVLAYGISETTQHKQTWAYKTLQNSQKINDYLSFNREYRYGESYVFKAYKIDIQNDQINYTDNDSGNLLTSEQLSNDLNDIINQYKKSVDLEIRNEDSIVTQNLQGRFYLESQMEEFIIANWAETELGAKYDLIYEDGDLKSKQYRTSHGRIDLLVKDKETGCHVVIELKKDQTNDDTVGQILRYMGWVKENLNDNDVKGIIIAQDFTEGLRDALRMIDSYGLNIGFFKYEIDFKLIEDNI